MRIDRLGFTKGVSPSSDPSVVDPQALWNAHNIRIDESGIARVRTGFDVFMASFGLGPVQGMVSAFGDIIMARAGLLHRVTEDGTITDIPGGPFTAQPADPVEFVRWTRAGAEIVYLFAGAGIYEIKPVDGVLTASLVVPREPIEGEPANLIRKADGTQDTASGPAMSRYTVLKASVGQRLCIAGDPLSPNKVYLSAPLDATYWPADEVIQLPDDGGKIVALANWYNTLMIFRDRDVWAFLGTSMSDAGAQLILQHAAIGCVAPRSVADIPGVGLVFLGPDNVYAVQGVSGIENRAQVVPIGDDIRKPLSRALTTGSAGICAIYRNREYWLSFPASQYEERLFRFSLQHRGWFTDTGPRASCYVQHGDRFYGGLWLQQQVVVLTDSLYDNTDPIRLDMWFRREGLGAGPARIKRLLLYVPTKIRSTDMLLHWFGGVFGENEFGESIEQGANVQAATSQHLSVKLLVDGEEFVVHSLQAVAERNVVAAAAGYEPVQVLEARFHPSLLGHFAQLVISGSVPGEDIALLGYTLEVEPRRMQRGKDV